MSILYYETSLYHHGVKNQKWGVRNGPPYPLNDDSIEKIDPSSFKTCYLDDQKEYAHVMHEVQSTITKEQRYNHTYIHKFIDDYQYTLVNNKDGTFRIIHKKPII